MKKEGFIVKKISLIDTLRCLPVGRQVELTDNEAKTGTIRKRATELKSEGMLFTVTERGMIGRTRVTRLK